MKCPDCGQFLKNVQCIHNDEREILSVQGECKRCGLVEPVDWCWEDFFPEETNMINAREAGE